MKIPRSEHPKPQFERENWRNLNGKWQFETDNGCSAKERELYKDSTTLSREIIVPFCPESKLSGIENKDFMNGVVYKREFEIQPSELEGTVKLHFGAVDYLAYVYVNENFAGKHAGGYVSFSFDITNLLKAGKNTVTVIVEDNTRDPLIPGGKQSIKYRSYDCSYTRTTGIWQTVWLEFMPMNHIESVRYYPNIRDCSVCIEASLAGKGDFSAEIYFENKIVGKYDSKAVSGRISAYIELTEKHLWNVGEGNLYNVILKYGDDVVKSYFGLREVRLDKYKFLINEKSVFQRLILDQGFYPDGIYTAPSDDALINDIKLSMAMGFNGARLHQKVFEERFLYHCDRLGYIVWGEYPSWGVDYSDSKFIYNFLPEWMEAVTRDFNHPSIIGWCPNNETWDCNGKKQYDDAIALLYEVTKKIDSTRPCIDTSGCYHVKTDIFDVHDYEQNPEIFKQNYDKLVNCNELHDRFSSRQTYNGEATFVSEYGGIKWSLNSDSWGYGEAPKTEEEFLSRFKGLTEALIKNKKMFGLCYTQLTDVEQECNGLYTYERKPKFDAKIIKEIVSQKAAIED